MRVWLEKIRPSQLFPAILEAFEGDAELKNYHINPSSERNMINHTHKMILKAVGEDGCKADYYYVKHKDHTRKTCRTIGFTVIFLKPVHFLYSFGIKAKYRNAQVLKKWMVLVKKKFDGKPIHTVMNEKNRRAIQFLEKNGFEKGQYFANDKTYQLTCQPSEQ